MGIQRLQPVTSSGGSVSTQFITLPNSKRHETTVQLAAGVYSVAGTVSHSLATVKFLDSNNAVLATATVSGLTPVVVSLSSPVAKIQSYAKAYRSDGYTLMGAIQIGITLTGLSVPSTAFSGTLTTYTSSQAITINGTALVIAVGGGGGGNGSDGSSYGGSGGGSGAVLEKYATNWSGAYTLVIGNGGSGINQQNSGGAASGGTTILSNAGGTILSAGGGLTGSAGNYGGGGGGTAASSGTYDFIGSSSGQRGHNWGNTGQYNEWTSAYSIQYQYGFEFAVSGGVGGTDAGTSKVECVGNGFSGTSGGGNATGNGNGGGGRKANAVAGSGSAGCLLVITGITI